MPSTSAITSWGRVTFRLCRAAIILSLIHASRLHAELRFTPASLTFDTGSAPRAIAIGDLNNDGRADLAVANAGSNSVAVLLGIGGGAFAPRVDYPAGKAPVSLVIADLDGDGDQDLAVASYDSSRVEILTGSGNGTFGAGVALNTGLNPRSIGVADLNGDGRPDIVTANQGAGTATIFLNQGSGTFGPESHFDVGPIPSSLALGDLNGDGAIDLAVLNPNYHHTLSLFYGNGHGAFGPRMAFETGDAPDGLVMGNLDLDGRPDIVVYGGGLGPFLHYNASYGGFGVYYSLDGVTNSGGVAIGDMNMDGRPDIVAPYGNGYAHGVAIYWGETYGLFSHATSWCSDSKYMGSVAIGDLDGDDRPDVVTTDFFAGGFALYMKTSPTGVNPSTVCTGDFNGDGRPDFAVGNQHEHLVSVLLGAGNGIFHPTIGGFSVDQPGDVIPGDWNGDGFTDLAVASFTSGTIGFMPGQGDGTFPILSEYPSGAVNQTLASADFNGDGKLDLAAANVNANSIEVLLGNGDGAFQPGLFSPAGNAPASIAAGDLDEDGRPDVAVANAGGTSVNGSLSVFFGNGDGSFAAPTDFETGGHFNATKLADVNGDGRLDVVASHDLTVLTLLSSGDGTFTNRSAAIGPDSKLAAIADMDGDGMLDLVIAGPRGVVAVLLGHGDGTFQPPMDFDVCVLPTALAVADINSDGAPDLEIVDHGTVGLSTFLNLTPGFPTATSVVLFTAVRSGDGIEVRWRFSDLGFHVQLQRGSSRAGPWNDVIGERLEESEAVRIVDHDVRVGRNYCYRLVGDDAVLGQRVLGLIEVASADAADAALRITPNPARGACDIEFTLARNESVRLAVLDPQGRVIARLADAPMPAGSHRITWSGQRDGHRAPIGIYFVRLEHGSRTVTRRLLFVR